MAVLVSLIVLGDYYSQLDTPGVSSTDEYLILLPYLFW
jgi:hypothetical protein